MVDKPPQSSSPVPPWDGPTLSVIYSRQQDSGNVSIPPSPFSLQAKRGDDPSTHAKVTSQGDIQPPSKFQQLCKKLIRPQVGKPL